MSIDIHHYIHFPVPPDPRLDQILALLNSLKHQGDVRMSALDDAISDLSSKVSALTAVDESAVALIDGIAAQIDAAVKAAMDAGANADQLSALNELSAKLDAETTSLGKAVAANTPAPQPQPDPQPEQPPAE